MPMDADDSTSSWAKSAALTQGDYDLMREMYARDGKHLVLRYGAERHRFAELIKAGLVKTLSVLSALSPGYELTLRGMQWAKADSDARTRDA